MFSDNLNQITFTLYENEVDMILHSLELYAYNLHFLVKKSCEDYELLNTLIFYTYNELLSHYSSNRYTSGYNPLKNCKLEIERMKKKPYYNSKQFFKKNIA